MANNLFVSYDLMAPGQHYDRVADSIKATGNWAKIEFSLYYVNSSSTAEQVAKHVWASMTANDKLLVVNTSNNEFFGFNIQEDALRQMQQEWYK